MSLARHFALNSEYCDLGVVHQRCADREVVDQGTIGLETIMQLLLPASAGIHEVIGGFTVTYLNVRSRCPRTLSTIKTSIFLLPDLYLKLNHT